MGVHAPAQPVREIVQPHVREGRGPAPCGCAEVRHGPVVGPIHARLGRDVACALFGDCALASPERSAEAAVKSVDFGSSSVPAIARLASHFDTAWTRSNVKMPPPRALTTSRPLLKGASVW